MTDTNPLAPIEALAEEAAYSGRHIKGYSYVLIRELRDALAEARQAVDALVAERDAAREALARVEALADEQNTYPGQCCRGFCLTGLHDLDADTLAAFREVIRAALAQPATDEEAGQ